MNDTFKKYSWLLVCFVNTVGFTYATEKRTQILTEVMTGRTYENIFDFQSLSAMSLIWFFILYTVLLAVRLFTVAVNNYNSLEENSQRNTFPQVFTKVYIGVTIVITLYLLITLPSYRESITSLKEIMDN